MFSIQLARQHHCAIVSAAATFSRRGIIPKRNEVSLGPDASIWRLFVAGLGLREFGAGWRRDASRDLRGPQTGSAPDARIGAAFAVVRYRAAANRHTDVVTYKYA